MKGIVKRISVKNFLTFKQVEVVPNRNLNIIIGPNGTGKSSLLCAVILGLSRKPSLIGRSKVLADYIRTGQTEATIQIELYKDDELAESVFVSHTFDINNKSQWKIDGQTVSGKDVDELVQSLNIQIDNLCQMLPQDRVQDFAKMNPQELLRSTQDAVQDKKASRMLDDLTNKRKARKKMTATHSSNTKQMEECKTLNARVQADIEIMNAIKEMKVKVDLCKKKEKWLEYDQMKVSLDQLQKNQKKSANAVKKQEKVLQPYETDIASISDKIKKLEKDISKITEELVNLRHQFDQYSRESSSQKNQISHHKADYEAKLTDARNHKKNIEEAKLRLSKLENDKRALEESGDSVSVINKKICDLNISLDNARAKESELRVATDNMTMELNNIGYSLKTNKNRMNELANIKNKQLEQLRENHPDTYAGVMWLRKNMDLFHGNVYEPMILELSFKDPRYARYLENTVPVRDLIAFTFESSKDMNLFLTKVRSQNLKQVNGVCSQPSNEVYNPPLPVEQIKQYGFSTYLHQTVTGPEAILRFLCKLHGIHRIPIGNAHTYKVSDSIPSEIKLFFSDNHRFSISTSRYTGAKSTSTSEVRAAKFFDKIMDETIMTSLQQRIKELQLNEDKMQKSIESNRNKRDVWEKKTSEILKEKQKLTNQCNQINTLLSRIHLQNNELNKLNNFVIDVSAEKRNLDSQIEKCFNNILKADMKITEISKKYLNTVISIDLLESKLRNLRDNFANKKTQMKTEENKLAHLKELLQEAEVELQSVLHRAREKLSEAKAGTNNCLLTDKNFPYRTEFAELPDDLQQLLEFMNELQTKIDCTNETDSNIVKEYEERERLIATLAKDIKELEVEMKKSDAEIQILKDLWLIPLQLIIADINDTFGEMFDEMGCTGEVKLIFDGEEDDFDKYGIGVMVKFRDNESLQQLSQYRQSGGERALATGVYLMSIQLLSRVPFRWVDEINQGMDPVNERKIFQILFNVISKRSSQYFILSPKLLKNLEYSPLCTVHVIQNGPMIPTYLEWDLYKFIAKQESPRKKRVGNMYIT